MSFGQLCQASLILAEVNTFCMHLWKVNIVELLPLSTMLIHKPKFVVYFSLVSQLSTSAAICLLCTV